MAKVLKCEATGADAFAYVQQAFTAADDIWLKFRIFYDAAALAVWAANFAEIADIRIVAGAKRALAGIFGTDWYFIDGAGQTDFTAGTPVTDTWHDVEVHWDRANVSELYIGGSLTATQTAPNNAVDNVFVGLVDTTIDAANITYVDDIKIGTTRGAFDIFSEDFEGATPLANFTFTDGTLTVVDDPVPPVVSSPEGISIAFDDPTLEPDPTWTRIDSTDNFVANATIDRGRSFELDRMDTGRATIKINDQDGTLDPTNTTGPYFGKIEPLLQVAIALHDPVADTWTTIYRGFIDDYSYDADPSQRINFLTLSCVDAFEILTAIEMLPDGTFGDTPDASETGNIVFAAAEVDTRINQALGNAGWPSTLATVFSGNVSVQRTVYSPGQSILEVIQEAADAEFPGLAVVYVSAEGKVTFHGRKAKFDPVGVSAGAGGAWTFTHWKSGDGTAVNASPTDTAHIRGISGNRGLSKIINSAIATPKGIKPAAVAAQTVTDSTSIGIFGVRSWSATDLITEGGLNDSLDANDETQLFAQYQVDNYKVARDRISQLTFKSIWPDDTRAGATWDLLCNAEISDLIDVTVDYPGGGGFTAEPFFIEGIHYQIGPATPEFWMVTLTLDVSPQAYFNSSPFTGDT